MERHHCIPLSLSCVHVLPSGTVNVYNLADVSYADHQKIHNTLNIDYKFIREFRKKHEHKLVKDCAYYEDVRELQRRYFSKLTDLPFKIVDIHIDSLKAQAILFADLFHYPFKVEDIHFEPAKPLFEYYFNLYHEAFIHRATVYSKQLRNQA